MKKKNGKFVFDKSSLVLTETCKFHSDFPKKEVCNSYIDLCKEGKVLFSLGIKDEPNFLTVYEKSSYTTMREDRKIYIIINHYKGNEYFFCFTLVKEDIKEIMVAYCFQSFSFMTKAA